MNDFKSFDAYEESGRPTYEPPKRELPPSPAKTSIKKSLWIGVLVLALIGGFLGGYAANYMALGKVAPPEKQAPLAEPAPTSQANQHMTISHESGHGVVADVAQKVMPAVVGITTDQMVTQQGFMFETYQYNVQVTGSGVVVSPNGYILTNSHVVGQGDKPIQVLFEDGTQLEGKVLWQDPRQDLAVLKVDADKPLAYAEMGDSDSLVIGERAIAIGNPLGLDFQRSVTAGYISGLNRTITVERNTIGGLIQTDASINRGNSGGPLLNSDGVVIGINTIKVGSAEGLGFSIPINAVKSIVNQLMDHGSYEPTLIGITGVDVDVYEAQLQVQLPVKAGVVVLATAKDSAADHAKLQPNDIITGIDNQPVTNLSELRNRLNSYQNGDTAQLTIVRNGEESVVDITFTPVDMPQ